MMMAVQTAGRKDCLMVGDLDNCWAAPRDKRLVAQ